MRKASQRKIDKTRISRNEKKNSHYKIHKTNLDMQKFHTFQNNNKTCDKNNCNIFYLNYIKIREINYILYPKMI